MPERFVIEDGYVGDLSEDLMRVQTALCNNLQKRLHVLLENTGIRMKDKGTFDITSATITPQGGGSYLVRVVIGNLAPVVFSDFIVCDPQVQGQKAYTEISGQLVQNSSEWEGFVILTREHIYSEEGVWQSGYPEGSPEQGLNVKDTLQMTLQLSESRLNDASNITLYRVRVTPLSFTCLQDYRLSQSLTLRTVVDISQLAAVTNVQVMSLAQRTALIDAATVRGDRIINTRSPHTNLMANQYMMRITWNSIVADQDVWAYDIRLNVISGASGLPIGTVPMTYLVLGEPGALSHELIVPAAEGVKYTIQIRAIELGPIRLAAPWSEPVDIIVGTDLIEAIPATPSLIIQKLYDNPTVLSAQISVIDAPPQPFMIQLFRESGTASALPVESATVVYEGDPGMTQLLVGQKEKPRFRARTVAPGGVCSLPTEWMQTPDEPMGQGDLYYAEKTQLAIPILAKMVIDSTGTADGYVYCAEFYPPTPGVMIDDMSFIGTGCYYYYILTTCPDPKPLVSDFFFQIEPSSYDINDD